MTTLSLISCLGRSEGGKGHQRSFSTGDIHAYTATKKKKGQQLSEEKKIRLPPKKGRYPWCGVKTEEGVGTMPFNSWKEPFEKGL